MRYKGPVICPVCVPSTRSPFLIPRPIPTVCSCGRRSGWCAQAILRSREPLDAAKVDRLRPRWEDPRPVAVSQARGPDRHTPTLPLRCKRGPRSPRRSARFQTRGRNWKERTSRTRCVATARPCPMPSGPAGPRLRGRLAGAGGARNARSASRSMMRRPRGAQRWPSRPGLRCAGPSRRRLRPRRCWAPPCSTPSHGQLGGFKWHWHLGRRMGRRSRRARPRSLWPKSLSPATAAGDLAWPLGEASCRSLWVALSRSALVVTVP